MLCALHCAVQRLAIDESMWMWLIYAVQHRRGKIGQSIDCGTITTPAHNMITLHVLVMQLQLQFGMWSWCCINRRPIDGQRLFRDYCSSVRWLPWRDDRPASNCRTQKNRDIRGHTKRFCVCANRCGFVSFVCRSFDRNVLYLARQQTIRSRHDFVRQYCDCRMNVLSIDCWMNELLHDYMLWRSIFYFEYVPQLGAGPRVPEAGGRDGRHLGGRRSVVGRRRAALLLVFNRCGERTAGRSDLHCRRLSTSGKHPPQTSQRNHQVINIVHNISVCRQVWTAVKRLWSLKTGRGDTMNTTNGAQNSSSSHGLPSIGESVTNHTNVNGGGGNGHSVTTMTSTTSTATAQNGKIPMETIC